MAKNKIEFTTIGRTVDGEEGEVKLKVKRPSAADLSEAELVQAARRSQAMLRGVLPSALVERYVLDNKLITEEDNARFKSLGDKIVANRKLLKKGGVGGATKSDGRKIALEIKEAINEREQILNIYNSIEDTTAEALGRQAHFNCLVARCTFWAEGDLLDKRYYSDVEDYLGRSNEPAAYDSAEHFHLLMNARDDVTSPKSTEDDFLHKYGFVDDEGRLIGKDGKFVDWDGNPLPDKGYEEEIEFVEFLDD